MNNYSHRGMNICPTAIYVWLYLNLLPVDVCTVVVSVVVPSGLVVTTVVAGAVVVAPLVVEPGIVVEASEYGR